MPYRLVIGHLLTKVLAQFNGLMTNQHGLLLLHPYLLRGFVLTVEPQSSLLIMRKLFASLILLLLPIHTWAQAPPTAIVKLQYAVDKISFTHDNGVNADLATLMLYKLYMNGTVTTLNGVKCIGTVKPWNCEAPSPNFVVGNNLLEVTVTPSTTEGESPKSTQLVVFYGVSQKEIITNTESQSIIKCRPGSYEMLRFIDATKIMPAVNAATKHVAYMFATSNAVYAIICSLLEPGT